MEKVIRNCVDCILGERKVGKQEGLLNTIDKGELPLDTYHVDHMGPMPSTKKNYRHIFVIVDAFTQFVWLYPTRSMESAEVLDRLKKQSVVFGNPRRIVSDRGTAFTSHAFEEYCKDEKIQHVLITTGVPRGNGQVERINRILIPLLTKLTAPKPEEWHRSVNLAQQYINSVPSRATGKAPFNLLLGVPMKIKEDLSIKELLESEIVRTFEDERDELRSHARERIIKVQADNKKAYNQKRKQARSYKEGELVAIKRTQFGPGLKLHPKFHGPYTITRSLRHDRYMLEKVGEGHGPRKTTASADNMKPWVDDAFTESSASDSEASEDRCLSQDGRV